MTMDGNGFDLSKARVAIAGLGLMGASLALALKGKCADLDGVEPQADTREAALRLGVVSRAEADPAAILPRADVIVLAAPLAGILDLLVRLPELAPQACVVLDLGSSKQVVVEAMAALPERFDPLGGHPVCGKERLSLDNADAGLYRGAPFVLTPLPRTTDRARLCAEQVVAGIGARLVWMNADAHDAAIAASSHLPYLLASALALATPPEAAALVGPGFRTTGRLAATPSTMMLSVLESNRANVLAALERFRTSLGALEAALRREDSAALQSHLDRAATLYTELTL